MLLGEARVWRPNQNHETDWDCLLLAFFSKAFELFEVREYYQFVSVSKCLRTKPGAKMGKSMHSCGLETGKGSATPSLWGHHSSP